MAWNELDESLCVSTSEVLETMFFASIIGDAEAGTEQSGDWISARVGFRGNPHGAFGVSVTAAAARTMTAGFLGLEDEELVPAQVGEVVCELANMICGSVLSRAPSETCFHLAHPHLVAREDAEHGRGGPGYQIARRCFDLGDGSINVFMEMNADYCVL